MLIVRTTSFVCGSITDTEPALGCETQIHAPSNATLSGLPPNEIVSTTDAVRVLILLTEPLIEFATHMFTPSVAIPQGPVIPPRLTVAVTVAELGSKRETVPPLRLVTHMFWPSNARP